MALGRVMIFMADVPRSGWIGYWMYVAAPVTKDHIVTLSYGCIPLIIAAELEEGGATE